MRGAVVVREAPRKVGHLAFLADSTQHLLYTPNALSYPVACVTASSPLSAAAASGGA
jgi:hypothetical protein